MSKQNKEFVIKDSGQRQAFATGAVRDTEDGKPRYDLVPPRALHRTALYFAKHCNRYRLRNQRRVAQLFSDIVYSANQFAMGNDKDDFLARIACDTLHTMQILDGNKFPKTVGIPNTYDIGARYDLIPPISLYRVAMHYGGGAKKYNPWNWAMGMQFSRFYSSLCRHMHQMIAGDMDEDHAAAVVFNAFAIMHFQEIGRTSADDMQSRIPSA